MREIPQEEFLKLIEAAHESRNIEFKPAFSWIDDNSFWLRDKILRTILGLVNTPDGGYIVIGIEEDENKRPVFIGLNENQINSFSYDDMKGKVDGFSSPNINFDVSMASYQEKKFVVIKVEEFDDMPIICRKDSQSENILKRGVIYCRSRSGPPQTMPVTEVEMRELMEIAVDKQQEKLRRRGYKYRDIGPVAKNLFEKQRKAFEK